MSLVTYANCNVISGVESLKGDQSHLIYLLHFTVGALDSLKFSLYLMCIDFWLLSWLFLFVLLFYLPIFLVFSLPELQGGKNYILLQAKVLDKKKDKTKFVRH